MVVLADTSVWVRHLQQNDSYLEALLNEAAVAVHPFTIAELSLGRLRNRREILSLLHALPEASVVSQTELLHFIEHRHMAGSGLGFVDAHLLASVELMRGLLWTVDKSLRLAADKLDLAYN
jgi:predicted nucleic acid-binding protein